MQPFPAEDAGAVGPHERRDDEVAGLHGSNLVADSLDGSNELVPHRTTGLGRLHRLVRPEVAAADRGARHGDKGVSRLDKVRVGDVLDANVAGAVHEGCTHVGSQAKMLGDADHKERGRDRSRPE